MIGNKKIILVILLFAKIISVNSQSTKLYNLATFDFKPIHFGFALSLNSYSFVTKLSPEFNQLDSVYGLVSNPQGGFNLGMITNFRLGEYYDLRVLPRLTFAERHLIYNLKKNLTDFKEEKKTISSTFVELPVYFKYKSSRLNNMRTYILGGLKYSLDLESQKDVISNEVLLKLKRHDLGIAFGLGFDFYLEYFKFAPEITFSVGLFDMLVHDNTQYTRAIDKLYSRNITVSFNFE